ncbi:hypothetical protein [Haloferula sargassicola]|uniref:Uncharacterized protein n=1 Tax=Haloferula sargassicola TaxID=490096 RepID=A0ABP9USF2_9BACT
MRVFLLLLLIVRIDPDLPLTAPGFTHRVRDSATLAPLDWIARSNVPGDGGWRGLTDPARPATRFFRLETD